MPCARSRVLFAVLAVAFGCHKAPNAPSDEVPPQPPVTAGQAADLPVSLASILEARDVPGLVASATAASGAFAAAAVGVRSASDPAIVGIADPFHLGSDTKAMTATLVGIAVDEGLLRWDETVPELFPDLDVDPGWAEVTVEALLQHRSGMYAETSAHPELWTGLWQAGDPVALRTAFAEGVLGAPPDYPVGAYLYSNFGYVTVGAAIDRRMGPWQDALVAKVFEPLGMDSCGFGPPASPGVVDAPWGHYRDGETFRPVDPGDRLADNPPAFGPAGTVHCNVADWTRFGLEHLAGDEGHGTLASADTYQRLHAAPPGSDYAGGWQVISDGDGRALTHNGSNTMFYATIRVGLDARAVYVAATNLGSDPNAALAVSDAITTARAVPLAR